MDNLRYYFDVKKGVTETYAKQKFQQMLQNTDNQEDVFNTIWANTALRGDLFPNPQNLTLPQWEIQAKGEFIDIIKNLDDDFFGFIKVR